MQIIVYDDRPGGIGVSEAAFPLLPEVSEEDAHSQFIENLTSDAHSIAYGIVHPRNN